MARMVLGGAEAAVAFCRFLEQSAMAALSMVRMSLSMTRQELAYMRLSLCEIVLSVLGEDSIWKIALSSQSLYVMASLSSCLLQEMKRAAYGISSMDGWTVVTSTVDKEEVVKLSLSQV